MTAEELFNAGRLAEALREQTAVVKKSPTDEDARFMLFVLLCYAGELERADKQLDVLSTQDEQNRTGTAIYHALLASEWERRQVFEARALPSLPPEAPAFAELRVQALQQLREGDLAEAESLIEQAGEATPNSPGKLNGESFDGIRDYDDVLGTMLEVFAGGRYIWMPVSSVRSLELPEPTTALDTLWRQAKLVDTEGTVADVHLPALYQPSYAHEDEAVKLGRTTDWVERGEIYRGLGQHLFLTVRDGERVEKSLLDFRSLELEPVH